MSSFTKMHLAISAVSVLTLAVGMALAGQENLDPASDKTDQPKHHDATSAPASADAVRKRTGDPYPLGTCPITGKKLGAMGDPDIQVYEGREVRFCCGMCPAKFENDLPASFAKLDEKLIKDQGPLYPLNTSLVTSNDLPTRPYEFVYSNRLIRLGAESEKAEFLKDPAKYMDALDKAVVAAQGKDYPIAKCPVSNEELGGEMGKPFEYVVAGRLVRLCCKDCKNDVEKDPAKYIALVDAARKGDGGDKAKPDTDHKGGRKHGGR